MTTPPASTLVVRQLQGFAVYLLANDRVELAVVPELGARLISLKNLRTGREWLWHPGDRLQLFKNNASDDFSISPLVGMDECLPTIIPCAWRGRQLPDHGEVWSQPWQVEQKNHAAGKLTTSIRLKTSPFFFQRSIELSGNEVKFDYQLSNLAPTEEPFIWAAHPLLRLVAGDELQLPDSTRKLLQGHAWINDVAVAIPEKQCAKLLATPLTEGRAAIHNAAQGDRLEFSWPVAENNTLGLWLTRGGWHGHHHFALEPTNAGADSLAVAATRKCSGVLAAHSTVSWSFSLRVGL
jgi:galactose mutarotase-like enzyme